MDMVTIMTSVTVSHFTAIFWSYCYCTFSQNEDEWKEFEEEAKKDYSGLKIQNLQINDDENDKEKSKPEFEEEVEFDDNGQTVVKSVGPWKKIEEKAKPVEEKPPGKCISKFANYRFHHRCANSDVSFSCRERGWTTESPIGRLRTASSSGHEIRIVQFE